MTNHDIHQQKHISTTDNSVSASASASTTSTTTTTPNAKPKMKNNDLNRRCKIETRIMKVYKEAEASEIINVQPGEKMVVSILTHSTIGGVLSITDSSGQSVIGGSGSGSCDGGGSSGQEEREINEVVLSKKKVHDNDGMNNNEMKEDSFVTNMNEKESPVQYDIQLLQPDSYKVKITSSARYQAEVFLLVKTIWRDNDDDNYKRKLQKSRRQRQHHHHQHGAPIISEVRKDNKKRNECKEKKEVRAVAFSLGAGYIPSELDESIHFTFIGRCEI